MRHSQYTESEIVHLLHEANMGVPVAEICSTARVSLRTFYRWRRRFGGLTPQAVMQMKDLEAENRRLRALVSNLADRLRGPAPGELPHRPTSSPVRREVGMEPMRASLIAAERCGGSLVGRFASVRGGR